ncbi:IDEAL domain-containing protein [Fictibacillus sp. WQ 8-8]|uniref:IDEAL domain-containing protein n=1 Tax=Fictibacillus sp. WQ 8-8 TaxID=2938788 RepID=UPI00210B65AD|nr:IDEAL domain-containing protein [Fictibacillus sp. WQ 8-8]MCQ6267794.1 IDEAL domain-containing protein [Fictibacillus sp. WQ 8-8]
MKNKKPYRSYTEIMKSVNTQNKPNDFSILDMYIQMILDELMFIRQLRLLEEKINDALESKDKPLFLELSGQYAQLRLIV